MLRKLLVPALALIAVGSGAWSPATAQTTDETSRLLSVSCPADDFCMAVGTRSANADPGSAPLGLAYRWDGASWHAMPTQAPPAGAVGVTLMSVSCTSSTFCLAGGFTNSSEGRTLPIAERWNGRFWRFVATQRPGQTDRYSDVRGVSCVASTSCVVVGTRAVISQDGTGTYQRAVAWQFARGALRLRATASRPFPYTALYAVSCVAADNCTAVGTERKSQYPLAEHWNGSRWTWPGRLPLGSGDSGALLDGISCPAPRSCVAVGTRDGSVPIVENRRAGGPWTQGTPPLTNVHGDLSGLDQVSCAVYQRCAAVGSEYAITGDSTGLMAWRDFTHRQFVLTESPAAFAGVDCHTSCVYVGADSFSPSHQAVIYRGRSQPTQQTIPAPPAI